MKKLYMVAGILIPALSFSQVKIELKGVVTDKETNRVLKDAHVYIDEKCGTITDEKGYFDLFIPADMNDQKLQISYLGYTTYEKPIVEIKDEFLKVNLKPGAILLNEVIVQADPWEDFRDIISEISPNYKSKAELYAAVFRELENMKVHNAPDLSENKASIVPGLLTVLIILGGICLLAHPFVKIMKNS